MNISKYRFAYLLVAALVLTSDTVIGLELSRYFSDGMVLQRDKALKIWGTAKRGDSITVRFAGQTVKTTADKDGRWAATLKPIPTNSKGQTLHVDSSLANHPLEVANVIVGDVFLFGRQTSIDVSLGSKPEGKKVAVDNAFRFITIKTSPSREPLNNLKKDATAGWCTTTDKKNVLSMSAAAFYLGRDLAKDVKVPVGIIDLNMGYHFGAAWLSEAGIAAGTKAAESLDERVSRPAQELAWQAEKGLPGRIATWEKRLAGYEITKKTKKSTTWAKSKTPFKPHPDQWRPIDFPQSTSVCYNSVLHPLRGLVVKGLLLQLGNDYPFVAYTRLRDIGKSADRDWIGKAGGVTYGIMKNGNRMTPAVLPAIVDDLRNSLSDASLPLGWIMPGGSDLFQYGVHNREVRELQRRTVAEKKGIDLILPGAENVPLSGQPADEKLLAKRCMQWVRSTFYGAKTPASGPVFERAELGNDTATVYFKEGTAEGLTATGDALTHFEVAGGDRDFVRCKAEINGSTIKLTADTGSKLMYVRYSWGQKPAQGLVNSAGLPAIPFTTNGEWEYEWWPEPAEVDLPKEYFIPASKWPERNYAIINYALTTTEMHLGPTGMWGAPAGPNHYVTKITPNSPADGKVFPGDVIYGVNGNDFSVEADGKYVDLANAISKAEAEKGGGTMVLNIRRDDKLIEVPIKLEYMGAFSKTTPWNCEKNENIVKKAEEYMKRGLRPESGLKPDDSEYMYGPWNDPVLFLLATGNPEMLGLARRYMRNLMTRIDESLRTNQYNKKTGFQSFGGWGMAYTQLLMGEYYHLTGDASILPYYQRLLSGTWYKGAKPRKKKEYSWPPPRGRYGTHPAAQMVKTMGALLAVEAGLDVDKNELWFNIKHLYEKRAENGFILYKGYGDFDIESRQIPAPLHMDSVKKATGHIGSMNGKLGTGAALFSMLDGYDKAVTNCAERCVYSFNHTRKGHGGAWFNNFWTPIGAFHAGKEQYQHFMQGQQWWRELYRDHTGSMWQAHNAKEKKSVFATGFAIHRVAHRKKLRMFGAPRSAFGPNAPAYLKEALAAHRARNYDLAEELTQKLLEKGGIPDKELPMVERFLDSVKLVKESVAYDIAYTEDTLKRGEYHLAKIELPQLKMVTKPGDARIAKIEAALQTNEAKAKLAAMAKAAREVRSQAKEAAGAEKAEAKENFAEELASIDTLVKDDHGYNSDGNKKLRYAQFPKEEWNRWRVKVFESPDHEPKGWEKPDFDDSNWDTFLPPLRWAPGHTGAVRTTFDVKDKSVYERLQVRGNVYKQRNLEFYLNGHLIAKVNNVPRQGVVDFKLTPYALKVLKDGKNHLAVNAEHGKRFVNLSIRLEGVLKK